MIPAADGQDATRRAGISSGTLAAAAERQLRGHRMLLIIRGLTPDVCHAACDELLPAAVNARWRQDCARSASCVAVQQYGTASSSTHQHVVSRHGVSDAAADRAPTGSIPQGEQAVRCEAHLHRVCSRKRIVNVSNVNHSLQALAVHYEASWPQQIRHHLAERICSQPCMYRWYISYSGGCFSCRCA
jgi:hypothetical protein